MVLCMCVCVCVVWDEQCQFRKLYFKHHSLVNYTICVCLKSTFVDIFIIAIICAGVLVQFVYCFFHYSSMTARSPFIAGHVMWLCVALHKMSMCSPTRNCLSIAKRIKNKNLRQTVRRMNKKICFLISSSYFVLFYVLFDSAHIFPQ